MKSIISIASLFIALSFSCKTGEFIRIKPEQRIDWSSFSPECKDFVKKVVRKRWKANKSGDCYFEDYELYNLLKKNQSCFIGNSMAEIKNIFGKPNIEDKNIFGYQLGAKCESHYQYYTIFFVGDSNEIVSRLSFDQVRID